MSEDRTAAAGRYHHSKWPKMTYRTLGVGRTRWRVGVGETFGRSVGADSEGVLGRILAQKVDDRSAGQTEALETPLKT